MNRSGILIQMRRRAARSVFGYALLQAVLDTPNLVTATLAEQMKRSIPSHYHPLSALL